MNADLKRVRDSSLDGSPSSSKRRALSTGASSPSSPIDPTSNSTDDDGLEDWMRVVEAKRKEAIYRQMLEYRRSFEREQSRASALERQRRALEQSLRSVEACWAQLVTSVRERAGRPDNVPDSELIDSCIDTTIPQSEMENSLKTRLSATLRLVSGITSAPDGKTPNGDIQQQFIRLQTEAGTLRAKSAQLESQVAQLCQTRDQHLRDLQRAEKRLDRQRMDIDKERLEWQRISEAQSVVDVKPVANGSGHSTPNARESTKQEPAEPERESSTSAETTERIQELEKRLAQREEENRLLRQDQTANAQSLGRLKLQVNNPSESILRESPFFQVYLQQLATQKSRADALQSRFEASEQKLDQLRDANLEFREAVLAEARAEVDALRQQASKKDIDLARLRGQRDEMNAELVERRQRESDKMRFAEEMEGLVKARQERITLLVSEVRRLKGKLAAQDRAEGYLEFLKGEGGIDGDYVKSLEDRLASTNDKITALSTQLEQISAGDVEAAAAETAVRTELETARRSLAKLERIFGPNADVADDIKHLADRLQKETEVNKQLELKLSEAEASTDALYTEVEGISKQWESLEHTLRTKVFELKDAELRMQRLTTEKAKADNKYYQAMRSKEAVDAECKTAQRSVDKQLKLLERAQEVERGLTHQIAQQDKGITSLKNTALDLQTQLATVSSEKRQLELRLQQSQSSLNEALQTRDTRLSEAAVEKEELIKAREDLEAAQRTVAKLRQKQDQYLSSTAATNMSGSEQQVREEREKLLKLLRCSCCDLNFKQQVITKCYHTFCKECLDSRIASRQRKCPACGLAFAKEDIQTLYWQ